MQRIIRANHIEPEGLYLRKVLYAEGADYKQLTTDWADTIGARDKTYVVETSPAVVQRCILMTTDPGDLVLDPFCGSGTTGVAALQANRQFKGCEIDLTYAKLAVKRISAAIG